MASDGTSSAPAGTADMFLEVVTLPVSDVDRAKEFYQSLGWRLDADIARGDAFRVIQFTPPHSACSVAFGVGVTTGEPGSLRRLILAVSDVDAARKDLVSRGIDVSGVFHLAGGRVPGPDPEGRSYQTYAAFSDPDGNEFLLQEITTRLPGRIDSAATTFASASDLANAMRRAEHAHGEHEKRTGERDENWPSWYAAYMVAEQAGAELPT